MRAAAFGIILLLALLACSRDDGIAQASKSQLTVEVIDDWAFKVLGASVVLTRIEQGADVITGRDRTDINGLASFTLDQAGTYAAFASAPGFRNGRTDPFQVGPETDRQGQREKLRLRRESVVLSGRIVGPAGNALTPKDMRAVFPDDVPFTMAGIRVVPAAVIGSSITWLEI